MSEAREAFINQQGLVEQLVDIHESLQTGRGRRHRQDALHRSGVVLTVAAWQSYVEKVIAEAFHLVSDHMTDPASATPTWAIQSFNLRKAQAKTLIKRFNTPDDVRVRDVFQDTMGFNPWGSWEWRQGPRQWDAPEIRRRTNGWVRVRHSVAHGFDLPDDLDWLKGENGEARLTLGLLNECRKHFAHLVGITDDSFGAFLSNSFGIQDFA
ncbi:HEPN domain-containing protein [Roseobacter sp. MH60115]|uniref:HEPN domain-containing protein n=1 Tax=Roseobacter sp. MH60115 TaxID=2785324 RepID=UPI0018A2E348|nr:HEPN domain-containing protein [Roseobacter sp. MH60115]